MKKNMIVTVSVLLIIATAFVVLQITNTKDKTVFALTTTDDEYNVIVVGSDPEGVAAAVSAARSGAKTLLLGEEDIPGGLFTCGMLNTLDMNRDKNGNLLTRGIFKEFYDAIGKKDSFSIDTAIEVFNDMIEAEDNLTYLPSHSFQEAIVEGDTIIGVKARAESGKVKTFYGERVIDATQNGDVAAAAGAPYCTGMEDINIDEKMAVTLVFKVENVQWSQLAKDIKNYKKETGDEGAGINENSAWAFGKWCYDKYTPIHDNMKLRGPNFGLQNDGTILLNALQIFNVDPQDEASVEQAIKDGKVEAANIVEYFRDILPSFANAKLVDTAQELYVREGRHIQGEYVLQAHELLDNTNFYDKIALGNYPIDIQSTSPENNGLVAGNPQTYSIPFRCLVPLKVENLLVVGKAASYSSVAAGSARVVPIGMVVGESAGVAAAYSINDEITPRELSADKARIAELIEILNNNGVYLPEFNLDSTIPDIYGIEQIKKLIDLGCVCGSYDNDYQFDKEATAAAFGVRLLNGLKKGANEEFTEENINLIKENSSEQPLTGQVAAKIILELFNIDTAKLSEEEIWQTACANGYFDDMGTEITSQTVLNIGQADLLTVNTLEKLTGHELKTNTYN